MGSPLATFSLSWLAGVPAILASGYLQHEYSLTSPAEKHNHLLDHLIGHLVDHLPDHLTLLWSAYSLRTEVR